ncbi:MAG: hypothetical protein J5554_14380 [Paludibacteraceae bacterium]|nr:hypothetical protein [Paludibacteraceae bacterium]
MKRAIVLGCSGSGKSTFSIQLHNLTGLPLYHLDNIWWNSDRTHISREEFDLKLNELVNLDRWIIDGDYSRTYEKRIVACDTLFFFDLGETLCMDGITERVGKYRSDIPWTEQELDPELVDMVKNYDKVKKPLLLSLLEKYQDKDIVVFHTREEAEAYLESFRK